MQAVPIRCYGLSALCGSIISLSVTQCFRRCTICSVCNCTPLSRPHTQGDGIGEDTLCYAAAQHVILHDLLSGEQQFLSPSHRGAVTHVVASADGAVLASAEAGPHSQVFVWHTVSQRRFATVSSLHGVAGLLLSPDGRHLAVLNCCAETGQVFTSQRQLPTLRTAHRTSGHKVPCLQSLSLWLVEDLARSPDATPLCTGVITTAGSTSHAHICAQWPATGGCTAISTGSQFVGFWDMTGGTSCTPLAASPAGMSLGQAVILTVSAFVPDREDQVAP